MSKDPSPIISRGGLWAILAYGLWGLVPIYWKQLQHVPVSDIFAHRILWSLLFYYFVVYLYRQTSQWKTIRKNKTWLFQTFLAAIFLATNWGLYIYAVNSNQITEGALGYFINPLFNVALGIFFFKERINTRKKIALILAGIATLILIVGTGKIPWIALTLGSTFSLYGLIRKKQKEFVAISSLQETLFMLPVALLILVNTGQATHYSADPKTIILLVGAGVITALPLLFFAKAAQLLPLSTLGFYQYLSPSLQFLTGVVIYKEPLSLIQIISFGLIWIALILITFRKTH